MLVERCSKRRTKGVIMHAINWVGRVLALILLAPVLAITASVPAQAAPADIDNCVGAFECLYFRSGYTDVADMGDPTETTYDLRPVSAQPANTAGNHPWQGTFEIVKHSTKGTGSERCLGYDVSFDGKTTFQACTGSPNQRWYAEPATDVVTDTSSPQTWNPWWPSTTSTWTKASKRSTKFLIRSAGKELEDRCAGSPRNGLEAAYAEAPAVLGLPCQNFDGTGTLPKPAESIEWNLVDYPAGTTGRVSKTTAQKAALTQYLLGSAIQHAMELCKVQDSYCAGQLLDKTNGAPLSDWDRVSALTITAQPNPVVEGAGCAGGAGAVQSVYNGGSEPMSTSISAGGESSYEQSVSKSLSVEVSTSVGDFVSTSVTISASQEWGQTWSSSTSFEQSIDWVVPPKRFATAVLSASAIKATAKWRFGAASPYGSRHTPWQTDGIVDLRLPYSDSPNAKSPDASIAVFNSRGEKSCSAKAPSQLADGHHIEVQNLTNPGAVSPLIGDLLDATTPDAWFVRSAGDAAPVNLAYQWYRVRGGETTPIAQATGATYTVTTDDLDDDVTRLFVTVTDVGSRYRFDSEEYASLRTGPVQEETPAVEVGPTQLNARVLTGSPSAGSTTRIEATATAANAPAPPTGSVVLRVDGDDFGAPATLVSGVARFDTLLPRGRHVVEAVYLGEGVFSGARSDALTVDVATLASRSSLSLSTNSTQAGAPVTLTATVAPATAGGPTPGGTVEFRVGDRALGNEVAVGPNGHAELVVPFAIGSHLIHAAYSGDAVFAPSQSSARELVVGAAPAVMQATVTTLAVSATSTTEQAQSQVTARVRRTDGQPAAGSVQLYIDGAPFEAPQLLDADGQATWTTSALRSGHRSLMVQYLPAPGEASEGSRSVSVGVDVLRWQTHAAITKTQIKRRNKRGKIIGVLRGLGANGEAPVGSLAGERVRLAQGQQTLAWATVSMDGRFVFKLRKRGVALARKGVVVEYAGNPMLSSSPSTTAPLALRRR